MTRSDRAVAGMLDFLTAVVIVVGSIAVYFTATAVLLDVQDRQSHATERVGLRASERLVEDALVADVGDGLLAPGCARALFRTRRNHTCAIRADGDGQAYLQTVFGIDDDYVLNVTITDGSSVLNASHRPGVRPYRHALGPTPPAIQSVAVRSRLISFGTDDDGDGRIDYYTATVRVWEAS